MIRSDEIIEAMENTASSSKHRGRMGDPTVADTADIRLWRDKLLRFFEDIDGDITVDEIVIALEDWTP